MDGARVVDDDVDAAKLFHSLFDGALDAGFVANIDNARQSLSPGRLNCSEQCRHLYGPTKVLLIEGLDFVCKLMSRLGFR